MRRKTIMMILAACAMAMMLVGITACGNGGQSSAGQEPAKPPEQESLFTEDGIPNPVAIAKEMREDLPGVLRDFDAKYPSEVSGGVFHYYYSNENVPIACGKCLEYPSSLQEGEWALELRDNSVAPDYGYVHAVLTVKMSGNLDTVSKALSNTLGINLSSSDFGLRKGEGFNRYEAGIDIEGDGQASYIMVNESDASGSEPVIVSIYLSE